MSTVDRLAIAAVSIIGAALGFWAGWNLTREAHHELTIRRFAHRLDEHLLRL